MKTMKTMNVSEALTEEIMNNYEKMTYVIIKARAAYRDGVTWTMHNIMNGIIRAAIIRRQLEGTWDVEKMQAVKVHDRKAVKTNEGKRVMIPIIPWKELVLTEAAKDAFEDDKHIDNLYDGISEDLPQEVFTALWEAASMGDIASPEELWLEGYTIAASAVDKYVYRYRRASDESSKWEALTIADGEEIELRAGTIDNILEETKFSELKTACHDVIIRTAKPGIKVEKRIDVFDLLMDGYNEVEIGRKLAISTVQAHKYINAIKAQFKTPVAVDIFNDFIAVKVAAEA